MNMSKKTITVATLALFALFGCSTNNTVADSDNPSTSGNSGDPMPQLQVPEYTNISAGIQEWLAEGGTEKRAVYISDTWGGRPEGTQLPFSGEVSLTAAEVEALIGNYNGFAIKLAGEIIDTGVLDLTE